MQRLGPPGGGVGHKADELVLLKIIVVKSKEVKTRWSNSQE
jgi:hypothetical protein